MRKWDIRGAWRAQKICFSCGHRFSDSWSHDGKLSAFPICCTLHKGALAESSKCQSSPTYFTLWQVFCSNFFTGIHILSLRLSYLYHVPPFLKYKHNTVPYVAVSDYSCTQ